MTVSCPCGHSEWWHRLALGGEWNVPECERMRLYLEHRDTEQHTGDVYVDGCPTCGGQDDA